jgi:TatD DNase family protein
LIDTHTHIYLADFDGDREKVIAKANESGIESMLMPAIDSSTHEQMMAVESQFKGCFSMIGLHPCSVNEDFKNELAVVEGWLEKRKFVAVGEIGLDYYWDKSFKNQQEEAFREQIGFALKYNLPIVIHSRDAIDECIAIVEEYPGLNGIFHCFSGNLSQAVRIIQTGFLMGIGGVVTFKNAGLDKVVEKIGMHHLVLETDAPYLAPVPYRGKRNEPSYTKLVAEKISLICQTTLETVEEITTRNARNLFRL